ncbi:hypothetical protein ACFTE1_07545 [Salininema proteolyticum]
MSRLHSGDLVEPDPQVLFLTVQVTAEGDRVTSSGETPLESTGCR